MYVQDVCVLIYTHESHPTQVKGSKSMALALRARDGSVAENLNLVPGIHVRAHNHRKSKALS